MTDLSIGALAAGTGNDVIPLSSMPPALTGAMTELGDTIRDQIAHLQSKTGEMAELMKRPDPSTGETGYASEIDRLTGSGAMSREFDGTGSHKAMPEGDGAHMDLGEHMKMINEFAQFSQTSVLFGVGSSVVMKADGTTKMFLQAQ